MGPSYAVWYRGLDKLIIGSGVKQTIGKVALDQGIMAWVRVILIAKHWHNNDNGCADR